MTDLTTAVDAQELAALHRRFGQAPVHPVRMEVDSPFLDGENQLLTAPGRRAEICYILHRGDAAAGILLHRKVFYPPAAFRLPTGGIHVGEGVLATLGREIEEETSFHLAADGSAAGTGADGVVSVAIDGFLGTLAYELCHRSQGRVHTFATYHFLVAAPPEALPVPLDPEEQIAAWQWRPLAAIQTVAGRLDGVGQAAPPWGDWGRFRAHSHRFVATALASGPGAVTPRTPSGGSG